MIKLECVSKKYLLGQVSVTALDNVSLDIGASEFVVVLGPSGSGKTTLLNIIGGLDVPSSGNITINGLTLVNNRQADLRKFRRETISFIFQTFNLFPGLTALENVQFALDVRGRSDSPGSPATARRLLCEVGLEHRLRHFPHQLSGGEQQRVAIARALATENPVLLADEPTGELDYKTGVQILELLQEQVHTGKTVLIVTHNREISQIADRVVELSNGRIIRDGVPHKKSVTELSW